ncbi:MAG: tetratricopeptide repeat protein [Desulfobacteraceae bacterium]|nr:tetratricopeptide repeat protein [Desulfobacteraceae bacterium]MBC2758206.1 tetratricopeptide repeat protein [Desulfobacteraceae bacterium]
MTFSITSSFFKKHLKIFIYFFLIIITCIVYQNIHKHDFINFDDNVYVTDNHHVKNGISPKNIIWAFNINDRNDKVYWHPLTWLSHMLDYELFGLNAGMHHVTSLGFHIANVLLLFLVLHLMTGMIFQSAFVAAVFAVHPINVDSVAWIAERKNVLSTMFWMLTMLSYFYYTKAPCIYRYFLIIVTMAAGLMAKPMLVTLPFVFLLLDFWPLHRVELSEVKTSILNIKKIPFSHNIVVKLIGEKIPLLALSLLTFIFSSLSLHKSREFISTDSVPMALRISNIPISYVKYMVKLIWPRDMAIFYPFPETIPFWQVISAGLILIIITIGVILLIKKSPYLIVGWLWYLGTLFPVIGLIQGGRWPEMAERWMYVPEIGLLIIISWGGAALLSKIPQPGRVITTLGAVIITALILNARTQAAYWQNSMTLFEHNLKVTPNNSVAHNNIGTELNRQGRPDEAIHHFLQALRIKPDHDGAHYNTGISLDKLGRTDEAIEHYRQALKINPGNLDALYSIGVDLDKQGRTNEAIGYYLRAIRINPDFDKAHNNIGNALDKLGRTDEAVGHYLQAIRINPDFENAYYNLGNALEKTGRTDEAILNFLQALRVNPDSEMAHNNLAGIYFDQDQMEKAIHHYQKAITIRPKNSRLHYNLAVAHYRKGNITQAIQHLQTTVKFNPDHAQAKNILKRLQNSQISK